MRSIEIWEIPMIIHRKDKSFDRVYIVRKKIVKMAEQWNQPSKIQFPLASMAATKITGNAITAQIQISQETPCHDQISLRNQRIIRCKFSARASDVFCGLFEVLVLCALSFESFAIELRIYRKGWHIDRSNADEKKNTRHTTTV